MTGRILIVGLMLQGAWAAHALATDADDIPKLIEQLAGDDAVLRRQAAEQLEMIGEPALEALRKTAREHDDVDVRLRALVIIRAITQGAFAELRVMGTPAGYWLNRVVFSPDGKQAVVTGGAVIWFDLDSGKEVRRVLERQFARNALALSPDGKQFLTGHQSDAVVRLGELATGKEVQTFQGHTGGVHAVAFAPDGKLVASGGEDKTVRLWDVSNGKEVRRMQGVAERVRSLTFSPDGKRLAVGGWAEGSATVVRIFDPANGKEQLTLKGHTDDVTAVKFLPDGKSLITASMDGTLRLWDAERGQEQKSLTHKGAGYGGAYDVAVSPDGKWALSAGFADRMVRLWDLSTGKEKHHFEGHVGHVLGVAFSADGKRALSCDANNTVRLWQVAK